MPKPTEPSATTSQGGGIAGDMRRLKTDGSATAAELRDFIGNMRGKSPQEMLGVIAQSGLVKSICVSTVLFACLIAVLTVGPYLLKSKEAAASAKPTNEPKTAATADAEKPSSAPAAASDAAASDAGDTQPNPGDAAAAAAALGIDETRQAPPDKNPLEKDLDNLLDGIK